jgi:dihydroneopterin aldolase
MESDKPEAVIHITGLEVYARHGLLPQEKENEQLFRIYLELRLGSCLACASDSIDATVDYAEVCDDVVDFTRAHSFELLEKLAAEIASLLLERYATLGSIKVRVEKVAPPVEHDVASVAVSLERRR